MDYDEFFRRAANADPFPWQREFALGELLPEVVRVPTGAGKTEAAALGWLWRRRYADSTTRSRTPRRLVYCLPMRVLVEQTVKRLRAELNAVGAHDIPVHQLMSGAVSRDWTLRPEDDAIIVGTLDQLVSRALMRGYGVSRYAWPIHFALLHNDALWVYDEVQLMGEALATSAQLDGFRATFPPSSGPVATVWMSATVDPSWIQTVDRSTPTRILSHGDEDRARGLGVRLTAEKRLERLEAVDAASVAGAHRSGSLTLVVMNTVKAARELFKSVSRVRGIEAELVLLHSRFRPQDRRAQVEQLEAPLDPEGPGRIVVATQVVEAGVDVSAATLITECAPWGSLVQRFGRCNRRGEIEGARVLWATPARPLPYEQEDVDPAAATLAALEGSSVSPDVLEAVDAPLQPPPRRFVIRRRDFLGLFDTAPDLSGLDLDVQRYIRDGDELTVSLAWRSLPAAGPQPEEPEPGAEELCPAPISELRGVLERRKVFAWRFDTLEREWRRVNSRDLRPGDILLTDTSFGCYEPTVGFDPGLQGDVRPMAQPEDPPESIDADAASVRRGCWLSIAEHTDGVCASLEGLVAALDPTLQGAEISALRAAARRHDWGKAHPTFQTAMRDGGDVPARYASAPLAKRVGQAPRYERPGFRHELVSLLACLAMQDADALTAYLVASHHGRVRLGARSLPIERGPEDGRAFTLGCWDGDELPATDLGGGVVVPETSLSLDPLELGSLDGLTYTDLALDLLDQLGPYRLAFLEAVLRIADQRRSAEEEVSA